jgi:hypothetical protein
MPVEQFRWPVGFQQWSFIDNHNATLMARTFFIVKDLCLEQKNKLVGVVHLRKYVRCHVCDVAASCT